MNHKANESLQHCAVHFRQSFYEFCFDAPRIGELTLFSWSKKMNISSPILKSIFSSSVKVWTVTCNCGTQSFKNQNRSNFLCEVWCYVMNEDVCTTLSHLSSMINGLQKHLHIYLYCILPIIYLYWDIFCKDGFHCTGHIVSLE